MGFLEPKSSKKLGASGKSSRRWSSSVQTICTTPSRLQILDEFGVLCGPHIDLALADRELQLSAARIAVNPAEVPAEVFGAPNRHRDPSPDAVRVAHHNRFGAAIQKSRPRLVSDHEQAAGTGDAAETLNFLGSYLTVEPPRLKFITPEEASCRTVKPSGFASLAK